MTSITTAMQLRTPTVWVYAPEPFPWIDRLLEASERPVFFYDPSAGLKGFKNDEWRPVIRVAQVAQPDGSVVDVLAPVAEVGHAVSVVAEHDGVIILFAADKMVDDFLGLLASSHFMWRNHFYADAVPPALPQFYLLATTPEIPDHLQSFATLLNASHPFSTPQLVELVSDLDERSESKIFVHSEDAEKIVTAAGGMTEQTTIDTLMGSVIGSPTHQMDVQDVIDRKAELLKASTSLEYHTPQVQIDHVAGLDLAKQMILNSKWILENEEEALKYGLKAMRRFLLLGLPGSGKSMICEAAATELGLGLVKIGVARSLGSYMGQSEKNIRNMFDQLERLAPICGWIDEVGRDLSGGASSNYTDGGTTARVHGEFLTRMQNLHPGVLLFAAANNLEHLEFEMLRAGRWDKIMFVGFPAQVERREIFRLNLETLPGEFDYDKLAEATVAWTGAEIVGLIDETKNRVIPQHKRPITTADILHYEKNTKNRIWIKAHANVVNAYRTAMDQHEWASSAQMQEAESYARGVAPIKKVSTYSIG